MAILWLNPDHGTGWLKARPVNLERLWCAISHTNGWESMAWSHFCQFQAPIQASRAPKIAHRGVRVVERKNQVQDRTGKIDKQNSSILQNNLGEWLVGLRDGLSWDRSKLLWDLFGLIQYFLYLSKLHPNRRWSVILLIDYILINEAEFRTCFQTKNLSFRLRLHQRQVRGSLRGRLGEARRPLLPLEHWGDEMDSCWEILPGPGRALGLCGLTRIGVTNIWLGGNDMEEEGVWIWTDCTPWEFTFWEPGEPNNWGGNENCLKFMYNSWYDAPCNRFKASALLCSKKICEGKVLSFPLSDNDI